MTFRGFLKLLLSNIVYLTLLRLLKSVFCIRITQKYQTTQNDCYDHKWFDSNETFGGPPTSRAERTKR